MAKQFFFNFTNIFGEEMEMLLLKLRSLISSKKITDNLPDNLKGEIDEINDKIEDIDIFISEIDGGTYDEENVGHIHFYDDWVFDNETYHSRSCVCGDVLTEEHTWDEGVVTTQPTHTKGVITYTCSVCGGTKTEDIPPIESPVLAAGNTWYQGAIDCSTITRIDIVPTYNGETYTESWDASEAQDGSIMCYLDDTILTIEGNGLDTIKANPNSSFVFSEFRSLSEINGVDILDTGNVTNMSYMFDSCKLLTHLDLSTFNTSNVTNMQHMFYDCSLLISLNLSKFNTSNVTRMDYMFSGCEGLTSLDLSSFDTANVTDMDYMFNDCNGLTSLDLSSFDTFNTKRMYAMFRACHYLTELDLSTFDTSNVEVMSHMFSACHRLSVIYVSSDFTTVKVSASSSMFSNSTSLIGGNGTVWDSNYIDATYARIDTVDTPGYFTEKSNT